MKILIGIATLKRGGAERVVSLLTNEWALNHNVTVALFDGTDQAYSIGGDLVVLGSKSSKSILGKIFEFYRRVSWIKGLINNIKPDRVFTFAESANLPFIKASKSCGTLSHLIISIHNPPLKVNKLNHYFMKRWYPDVKKIVVVGEELREEVAAFLTINRNKTIHIPNPISLKDISKQIHPSIHIHKKPFLLGMGRLTEQKGFDLLIKTFASISEKINVDLLIYGNGHLRGDLINQIKKLKMENRIFLRQSTDKPFLILSQSKLLILSSRYEGWGLVLAEAMGCKTPVISFDCPVGPRQILDKGKYGLLVPEGNTHLLAKAILNIIDNEKLQNHFVKSGYERAKEFDVKRVAPEWLYL